ncbi:MAG: hypothetical protein ETSY2_46430 [Candidatus Entotheonella gemina]|uniref:Uncharacterized protein n=1 Tax=Candidatus Entotheonella gemina TaxID=1429439 RepID=W4LES2_9BACT|nr:MAG: hypothetical protein ETSY2_46430 [Candidatus Entotheonella gemina]
MIENDTQLKVSQEQIQRLESALAQLRRTVTQVEFNAQAPVIIEHVRRMRDEIDTYLGVREFETLSSKV